MLSRSDAPSPPIQHAPFHAHLLRLSTAIPAPREAAMPVGSGDGGSREVDARLDARDSDAPT